MPASHKVRRDVSLFAGRAADADAVREARIHADVPEGIGAVGVLSAELPAGNYTAIVRGVNNTIGVALVEVYDLGP